MNHPAASYGVSAPGFLFPERCKQRGILALTGRFAFETNSGTVEGIPAIKADTAVTDTYAGSPETLFPSSSPEVHRIMATILFCASLSQ